MTIKDTIFRYNLQQTKQALHDTDFWRNMEEIASSSNFSGNSKAKKILQPNRGKTIVRPKNKTPVKVSKKQKLDNEQVTDDSHAEEISTRAWETLRFWETKTHWIKWEKISLFGGILTLRTTSSLSRAKYETFLE